ncbi:porin [Pararobbsia silviterrae]|nr:porin [Pararobbsia silviterrae]
MDHAHTRTHTYRAPKKKASSVLRATLGSALFAALGVSSTASLAADSFLNDYFQGVPYATFDAYTPGISLYGAVDESVGYMKGATSQYFQSSSGEWTSKFGIYGVEDLGGGWRARFDLENGFNAANGQLGAANTLFNREAWVSLYSPNAGELKFGLQDDIGVPLFVDVFGQVGTVSAVAYLTAWVYDLGPGASYEASRLSNAISYSTPWYGPLNAQFAVAMSNSADAPTIATRSVALNYYDGHLFGTLSYVGNYGLDALTTSEYVRTDNYAGALLYDKGNYVLSAAYSFLAPRLAGDRVASLYTAGALYRYLQRNDFRLELAYRKVAGFDDRSFGVTLGYDYDLSKRTAVYVRGSVIRTTGSAATYGRYPVMQPTVDDINNSYTDSNGMPESYQAPHVVLVGLYHKF